MRHASGYESFYLHLSAFAQGIRAGASVGQGETVGRVGSTGLATGPHLHYGLQKNGVFVNPLREHRNLPPGDPIPASAMAAFEVERDRALAALDTSHASVGVQRHPVECRMAALAPFPGASSFSGRCRACRRRAVRRRQR